MRRVLEPACGTGRLVAALAKQFEVLGFDLSDPMLAYARKRLQRRKLSAQLFTADMAQFKLDQPIDAAFNTFNSFRHLLTEDAALSHLRCIAAALRTGGLYILGLHLLPPDASEESLERWSAEQGRTKLTATLKVIASSRRQRLETLRMTMRVRTPKREHRLKSDFTLRLYNARQLQTLLKQVPEFELCDVFDFWYEIDHPLKLTNELSDTVLVLRKR